MANHEGFRDITIDLDMLQRLPEDGDVLDDIPVIEIEPEPEPAVDGEAGEAELPVNHIETSTVPNVAAQQSELEALNRILFPPARQPAANTIPTLDWPSLQTFRYSQQGRGTRIFSSAFPYLFPTGAADWAVPRPRGKPLKFRDWMLHMLKYHDGRFAKHDRFRYACFNLWMRDMASGRSRWVLNHRPGQPLTVQDIRDGLADGSNEVLTLLNRINRGATSIKGIRSYWAKKRRELLCTVRAIGKPAFFFTFSAADTKWDSLNRHFPNYDVWRDENTGDYERHQINSLNLNQNPHIATSHFHHRFSSLLRRIMIPKFGIQDYWYRYEFQGRGSTHVHGFAWGDPAGMPEAYGDITKDAEKYVTGNEMYFMRMHHHEIHFSLAGSPSFPFELSPLHSPLLGQSHMVFLSAS